MAFKYGRRSLRNIETTNEIVQEFAKAVIKVSSVDIGVLKSGGARTKEEQHEIYLMGNSKCDGYIKQSRHQTGMAIDLIPYVDGKYTWKNKWAFLAIKQAADIVKKDILLGNSYLHWGGYWGAVDIDGDGILEITDRLGWDCAHYQFVPYPQVKGVYRVE